MLNTKKLCEKTGAWGIDPTTQTIALDKLRMKMLRENKNAVIYGAGGAIGGAQVDEGAVVARFVARVNALGPLSQASPALQARLLEEVKTVARRVDGSTEAGAASGYDRRVLYEDPDRWSLAAISLRPGQQTHPHDHGGWGCAVTVQGVERDRRFVHDASGNPVLSGERDYPPGTGYVFDAVDVHQPVGADPRRVTVALHFLVYESHADDGRRRSRVVKAHSAIRSAWVVTRNSVGLTHSRLVNLAGSALRSVGGEVSPFG